MIHRARSAALVVITCGLVVLSASATPHADQSTPTNSASATGCLAAGDGYFRARVRGALTLDLNWTNATMECEGGARPGGDGVRVSIGGPLRDANRRIRFVFGVTGATPGASGENLRTNLTVLFEGERRIFATLGDDKCTVDSLSQRRVGDLGEKRASYRIEARGFCLGPASSLSREERVVVTSFDFAGRVEFEDEEIHAATPKAH